VLAVTEDCGKAGVKALVVISAAFRECGLVRASSARTRAAWKSYDDTACAWS
jgi:acyl-CoA synthetase (NDP forming)